MFAADCPACGVAVLLTQDQIVALAAHGSCWAIDALCWCGEPVVATLPRPAADPRPEPLASA